MTPRTPGNLAKLDQNLAPVNARLDGMLRELRDQITANGEFQGFANLALAISHLPRDVTDEYLLAAIQRLARQPAATQTTEGPRS